MATAHLIFGRLGVGKTTLARRLESEHSALRFSHDEWMSDFFGEDPPAHLFASRQAMVSSVMERIWARCMVLGLDVILDCGFWRRAERDAARLSIKGLGGAHRLYEVVCPETVAWRRIERRNNDLRGSLLITRPTFDALGEQLEPLGDDEPHETIINGGD